MVPKQHPRAQPQHLLVLLLVSDSSCVKGTGYVLRHQGGHQHNLAGLAEGGDQLMGIRPQLNDDLFVVTVRVVRGIGVRVQPVFVLEDVLLLFLVVHQVALG